MNATEEATSSLLEILYNLIINGVMLGLYLYSTVNLAVTIIILVVVFGMLASRESIIRFFERQAAERQRRERPQLVFDLGKVQYALSALVQATDPCIEALAVSGALQTHLPAILSAMVDGRDPSVRHAALSLTMRPASLIRTACNGRHCRRCCVA